MALLILKSMLCSGGRIRSLQLQYRLSRFFMLQNRWQPFRIRATVSVSQSQNPNTRRVGVLETEAPAVDSRLTDAVQMSYRTSLALVRYTPSLRILPESSAFCSEHQQQKTLQKECFLLDAPAAGFEPATNRLTVDCSTAELRRNMGPL